MQPGKPSTQDVVEFQGELEKIAEGSRFITPREILVPFGDKIGDKNKIHRSVEVAKAAGFEDTPVYGTYEAAQCEQYVLKNLRFINDFFGEQFVYAGQSMEFKSPLYPDMEASWKLGKIETLKDGLDLNLSLINPNGKILFKGISKLKHKRRDYPTERAGSFSMGKYVTEKEYEIDVDKGNGQDDLTPFYEFLNTAPRNFIPSMFYSSFPVSALVDFGMDESEVFSGFYRTMNLDFHDYAQIGKFKTILRMPEEPIEKRRIGNEYNFDIVVLQDGVHIVSGNIKCYSKKKFDI